MKQTLTRRQFLVETALATAALATGGCRKHNSSAIHDRSIEYFHKDDNYPNLFCHPNDPDIVLMNSRLPWLEQAVNGVPEVFYGGYGGFASRCPVIREEENQLMVYFLAVSVKGIGRIMRFPYEKPHKTETIADPYKYHHLDLSPNEDLIKRSRNYWYLEDRLLRAAPLKRAPSGKEYTLDRFYISSNLKVLPYKSLKELEVYSLSAGGIYQHKTKKVYDDIILLTEGSFIAGNDCWLDFELIGSDKLEKIVALIGDHGVLCDLWVYDLNTRKSHQITRDVENKSRAASKEGLAVSRDGRYAYVLQGTPGRVFQYKIDVNK